MILLLIISIIIVFFIIVLALCKSASTYSRSDENNFYDKDLDNIKGN